MAKRKKNLGQQSDERALATISKTGWKITQLRAPGVASRFVARKRTTESDNSVTSLYESALTLDALARQVTRREEEEGQKSQGDATAQARPASPGGLTPRDEYGAPVARKVRVIDGVRDSVRR